MSSFACALASIKAYNAISPLYAANQDVQAITFDRIKEAAQHDNTYQTLLKACQNGFPSTTKALPHELQPYWKLRFDPFVAEGLIMFKDRTLIPSSS